MPRSYIENVDQMCYNIFANRTLDVKSVAKQLNNITILTGPVLAICSLCDWHPATDKAARGFLLPKRMPMMYKFCHSCQTLKSVSEFNKNKARSDGLQTQCRVCHNNKTKEYNKSPHGRVAMTRAVEKYQQTEKGRVNHLGRVKKYAEKYPEKTTARRIVNNTIRKGLIVHPRELLCSYCKEPANHYHHYNGYGVDNIFDIAPVCIRCHTRLHRG